MVSFLNDTLNFVFFSLLRLLILIFDDQLLYDLVMRHVYILMTETIMSERIYGLPDNIFFFFSFYK